MPVIGFLVLLFLSILINKLNSCEGGDAAAAAVVVVVV
jgi:hypothetical protein